MPKAYTSSITKYIDAFTRFDRRAREDLPLKTATKAQLGNKREMDKIKKHNIVVELARVSQLRKIVEAQYETAKTQAIAAGVCGDFDNLGPGVHDTFDTPDVHVTVVENNPTTVIDSKKLEDELLARYGHVTRVEIIEAVRVEQRGGRIIAATVKPKAK